MKYIDEFRNRKLILSLAAQIKEAAPPGKINLMEVCGTHTQSFRRFGLHKLVPKNLNFIAGPGCPVCVCDQSFIDRAISMAKLKGVIIATFGDMLRVPGTASTLEKERAAGAEVRVVYSCWDSLSLAQENPSRKVIFLAVGFETTAPTIALSLLAARKEKLKNIFFFSSLKTMPYVMEVLLRDKDILIDGFICPGHVSTIIGGRAYEFIPRKYGVGCCIAGFEPVDMLEGILMLLRQLRQNKARVEIQYKRVAKMAGNPKARRILKKVFLQRPDFWRGIGVIPKSGLGLRQEFSGFDAEKVFGLKRVRHNPQRQRQCKCGEIIKGKITPLGCPLFAKACTPDNPVGPCMVSSEGACSAYYQYR